MGLRQKIKDAVPQDIDHALVVYVNRKGVVTAGMHGDANKCAEGFREKVGGSQRIPLLT